MKRATPYLAAVLFLLIANIVQIVSSLDRSNEVQKLKETIASLQNKISSTGFSEKLLGQEVRFDRLSEKGGKQRSSFMLLSFFSFRDCSSCLTEETFEWEKLHRLHREVNVLALCTDTSEGNLYRYKAKYQPTFAVYPDEERLVSKLGITKTPFVLLLNKHGRIVLARHAKVGEDEARRIFYEQITHLLHEQTPRSSEAVAKPSMRQGEAESANAGSH
jgi:peroxiredoxin